MVMPSDGLSPATRGTHAKKSPIVAFGRFIPGYAGNAFGHCRHRPGTTVYPRLRGEREQAKQPNRSDDGLSPATRGMRDSIFRYIFANRFIPGYAGNAGI